MNRGDDVHNLWTDSERREEDRGFTLVELMVVVLILGVLALVAIASYGGLTARAAEAACLSNQRTLNGALEVYRSEHSVLPATFTIDDLETYANAWDVISVCPADHAPLYYDDVSESIVCPNHVFP